MDKRFNWTRKSVITMLATERLIFDNIKEVRVWTDDVDVYVGGSRNTFGKAIKRLISRFDEVFSDGWYENGYIRLLFAKDFIRKENLREFYLRDKDEYQKRVDDAISRIDEGRLGVTTTREEVYAERRMRQYNEDLTHAHAKHIPEEMFEDIMWFMFRDDPKVLAAYNNHLDNETECSSYVWEAFNQLVNSYFGMHGISTCAVNPVCSNLTRNFFTAQKKLPQ